MTRSRPAPAALARRPPARRRAVGFAAVLAAVGLVAGCARDALDRQQSAPRDPRATERPKPPPPVPTDRQGRPGVLVGALPAGIGEPEIPGSARYVDPQAGDDAGPGTRQQPWRTVTHAVGAVHRGATVVLRGGVYRESVLVRDRTLALVAEPGEEVWFDGADPVTGFVADVPGRWIRDDWHVDVERLEPTDHLVAKGNPLAGWPDQVFVDGEPQELVGRVDDVGPGRFFVDPAAGRLVVGYDPAQHTIEASTRAWALYLDRSPRSRLEGFGVRRYATPASQLAAVRVHSDSTAVNDLVLQDNAYAGLSVMATDVTVTQVTARRNGQLGVQARNADRLWFGRNLLEGNNTKGFDASQQAGGMKITASRDVHVESTLARDNAGQGIWLDQSVLRAELVGNTTTANGRNGLMVELSAKVVVAGNLVVGNGTNGVYVLESNDVDVSKNTIVGNAGRDVWIVDGERSGSDTESRDHDRRFPVPDPAVSFDVQRVRVADNVLGDDPAAAGHAAAVIGVEDTTGRRSAHDMAVSSDHNAYWRHDAGSTNAFSTWASYPEPVEVSPTFDGHRTATGQDHNSRAVDGGTNPWIEGTGDQVTVRSDARWLRTGGSPPRPGVRRLLDIEDTDRSVGRPVSLPALVPSI